MKILFILHEHPHEPASFPLGAGLLSAVLKNHGYSVAGLYLHAQLDQPDELLQLSDRVREEAPDILAFSFNSVSFEAMSRAARHLKRQFGLPAIAGGIHPTLYPVETLAGEGFDYICVGDGEKALPDFVAAVDRGDIQPDIPGVWYCKADGGSIVSNRLTPLDPDLDSLPRTDYDLFGAEFIEQLTQDGWLRFLTSRGCPYQCSYCHNRMIRRAYSTGIGLPENQVGYLRFRSVDSVISEIKETARRYNLRVINFMDDLFCLNRQRTLEFCERFAKELPGHVGYSIQTHLEHLDEEVVARLRESRCLRVVVGVESASPRILSLFKRKSDPAAMEEKVRLLVAARFPLGTWTLNMLGNPTETRAEMLATLAFNARCLVERIKVNFMAPYPGSDLYGFCQENNLLADQADQQQFEDRMTTRLIFPPEESVFLERFAVIGHWYLNAFSPLPVAELYRPLIEEAEQVGAGEWDSAKQDFLARDKELSARLNGMGTLHYRFVFQGKVSAQTIGLTGNGLPG